MSMFTSSIQVTPVDKNATFIAAAKAFLKQEGMHVDINAVHKCWIAWEADEIEIKVYGIAGVEIFRSEFRDARGDIYAQTVRADVPFYRVIDIRQDKWKPLRREALKANELLFFRIKNWVADTYGVGTETYVLIEPDMRDHWGEFFNRVGATESNRVIIKV